MMSVPPTYQAGRRLIWMLLILLVASFLRLHDLPQIPPGMTHDEADHGLDAWDVVQGQRPIYFTVGYGREPLFDYSTAIVMTFLGPSFLAGRLTSVFFSLILIAGSYAWIRQALDGSVGLLAAAGLALGFWPLMTARQALRSETLPALLVVGVVCFWRGMAIEKKRLEIGDWRLLNLQSPFILSGLFLGLTFYTYIPSRILWLLFPALALYCTLLRRRAPWRGVLVTLGVAALVGLPLFIFLLTNPGAETRIAQLSRPLQQAAQGDLGPLWANVRNGLRIISVMGDSQWRYNIAGRPLLSQFAGALFYLGLLWSAWRVLSCLWRSLASHRQASHRRVADSYRDAPAHFFALLWLALGLAPVLATGRELSTTQAIGMQPVLYLFPALTLVAVADWLKPRLGKRATRYLLPIVGLLLGALLLVETWQAYFLTWARRPEVAVQYETELVQMINYLEGTVEGAVALSTDAPGRFHDPATAQLYQDGDRLSLRWFNGRHSLLFPVQEEPLLFFSASAPLNAALAPYLDALEATAIPAGPGAAAYRVNHSPSRLLQLYPQFSPEINTLSTELSTEIMFGEALRFLAHDLQIPQASLGEAAIPGDTVRMATLWQAAQPPGEELVIFTHVVYEGGAPLAQADRLDVPSFYWHEGDTFIQLHEFTLPPDVPAGEYALTTGIYRAADPRQRLPLFIDGVPMGDTLSLPPLVVTP